MPEMTFLTTFAESGQKEVFSYSQVWPFRPNWYLVLLPSATDIPFLPFSLLEVLARHGQNPCVSPPDPACT